MPDSQVDATTVKAEVPREEKPPKAKKENRSAGVILTAVILAGVGFLYKKGKKAGIIRVQNYITVITQKLHKVLVSFFLVNREIL